MFQVNYPRLFEIAVSIIIGGLIQFVVLTFHPPTLQFARRAADDAADQMIRLAEQTSSQLQRSPAYTLITVDDATYNAWGSHQVTPREHLVTIIDRVARSNALAILLDVDLSFSDAVDMVGESKLRDFLARYPATAPPLLLVRSLYHEAPPPALLRLRQTFYDDQTAAKENIVWGSPLFERDADGKIRRWRLFVQACAGDHPVVLPALHLAAAVIARAKLEGGENPIDAAKKLPERLARFGAESCERPTNRSGTIVDKQGNLPNIEIDNSDVSRRVLYRIEWRSDVVSLGQDVRTADGQTPLVAVRPARLVLDGDKGEPIPGLGGKFVVIGGSFADSGDWYDTPLGRMPGPLLLINAIEALTLNGTPREPSTFETVLISSAIILMSSILAAFFRPIIAGPLAGAGIFLIMLISLPRFQSGVVLNLAIPAVGAVAHDLFLKLDEQYRQLREQGWRFIFKNPNVKPAPFAQPSQDRATQTLQPEKPFQR
jgi:CHASE2 domain-containing sensor protein